MIFRIFRRPHFSPRVPPVLRALSWGDLLYHTHNPPHNTKFTPLRKVKTMSMLRAMNATATRAVGMRVVGASRPMMNSNTCVLIRSQYNLLGAAMSSVAGDNNKGTGKSSSHAAAGMSEAAAHAVASGTTSRSIGTKREIGAKVKEEEMRPGERSQVHGR